MEFTQAHLAALDPENYRYRDTGTVLAAGKKGQDGRKAKTWVEMYATNHQRAGMPTHVVRLYSNHVLPHCEGPTILDWHEVWGGEIAIIGERLVLTGFSQGLDGKVKDGQPEPGNRLDGYLDEGQPFVGVEWTLVP